MTPQVRPRKSKLFQYGLFALPLAFAGLPLYIHAPDFYTRELGLNVGVIGVILLCIRLFDAVQDPILGYLCDKFAPKRFALMITGAALLISGMGAVFYGPQLGINTALWFAASLVLATTGFSILTINLNMIGGFWSDQKSERTTISAWREGFALFGLLIASILPAALQNSYDAELSYEILFLSFAGIFLIAFFLFCRFFQTLPRSKALKSQGSKKGLAFLKVLTGPDKHFFIVCFLTHLAASFPGVLVLFFIRDYLDAHSYTGLFLLLYFLSGAILMPLWVKLAKHIGKERTWLISMVLAIVTFIWAYFLASGDIWQYAVICVLSGLALGSDMAIPPSILADRITAQKTEEEATQYYALLAFIPKTALALASGISLSFLGATGFEAGLTLTQESVGAIITLYALVPCLIKAGAAYYLFLICKKEGERYVIL